MADIKTDLIVKAIAQGFDKVSKDVKDLGKAGDEAEKGMKKGSKGLDTFSVALGTLAAGALTAVASKMADFVKGSIDVASSAAETASLLENSLGPAAQGFRDDIQAVADATNRSAIELEAGSSTIVAMTKSMGFGQQAAADFSVSMAQIATDLGSFFNQSTEQVFQDIQSALAGSSETMLKYGIDVKETALQQAALKMGLVDTMGPLDRVTRATVLQAEIQRQASDAMGDAELTADSFSNTQRGLEAATLDLQAAIGENLLPTLLELTIASTAVVKGLNAMLTAAARSDQLKALSADYDELHKAILKVATEGRLLDIFESHRVEAELTAKVLELLEAGVEGTAEELIAYAQAGLAADTRSKAMNRAFEDLVVTSDDLSDSISEVTRMTVEQSRAIARANLENQTYEVTADQVAQAERDRAAAHDEAAAATEAAAEAALALQERLGGYFVAALPAVEATGSLEEQLFNMAEAAGAGPGVLAQLAAATGSYSPEAIQAALAAATFNEAVGQMAAAVASGHVSVPAAIQALQDLQAQLANPLPPVLIESNIEEATASLTTAEAMLAEKLGVFTAESQGLSTDASTAFGEMATAADTEMARVEQAIIESITNSALSVATEMPIMATTAETQLAAMATSAGTHMTATTTAVATGMADVVAAVSTGWSDAVTASAGFVPQFQGVGADIAGGMAAGVQAGEGALVAAVIQIVNAALAAAAAAAGTASPSTKTKKIFEDFVAGGVVALNENADTWAEAVAANTEAAVDRMGNAIAAGATMAQVWMQELQAAGVGVMGGASTINALISGVGGNPNQVVGFATGGFTGARGGIVHPREFVIREAAVQGIGLSNLNAMNQTGQIPAAGGINVEVNLIIEGGRGANPYLIGREVSNQVANKLGGARG